MTKKRPVLEKNTFVDFAAAARKTEAGRQGFFETFRIALTNLKPYHQDFNLFSVHMYYPDIDNDYVFGLVELESNNLLNHDDFIRVQIHRD